MLPEQKILLNYITVRNVYKAIPFLLWSLSSFEAFRWAGEQETERPALGKHIFWTSNWDSARNSLWISVFWALKFCFCPVVCSVNSQGDTAISLRTSVHSSLALRSLVPKWGSDNCVSCVVCLLRLHAWNSDYTKCIYGHLNLIIPKN